LYNTGLTSPFEICDALGKYFPNTSTPSGRKLRHLCKNWYNVKETGSNKINTVVVETTTGNRLPPILTRDLPEVHLNDYPSFLLGLLIGRFQRGFPIKA
jgi:hypothetical protein